MMMKKLYEVSFDDAMTIISYAYPTLFVTWKQSWKLTDESKELREPGKLFINNRKAFHFYFMDNEISIHDTEDCPTIEFWCDVKLKCYLKAHSLGYYVPGLTELVNSIEEITRTKYETF